MVKRISTLAKELEDIVLSSDCGKYHTLVWDGRKAVVIGFVGKNGYSVTPISKLSEKILKVIFDDLKVDFEL